MRYMLTGEACFDTDNGRTDPNGGTCNQRVAMDKYKGGITTFKCDDEKDRTVLFDARKMCCACGGGASK